MGVIEYKDVNQYNNGVKEEIENEMKIRFGVVLSDTASHPLTVMIHSIDTNVTASAMVIPGGF